jgi:hypothetical protein
MNNQKGEQLIDLALTKEETNLIIEGLGALPFKQVYKLIEKIHLQANAAENPSQETISSK